MIKHDYDMIGRYQGYVWRARRLMPGFEVEYRGETATLPYWTHVMAWIKVEAEAHQALRKS